MIAELPSGRPSNLATAITQFSAGKLPALRDKERYKGRFLPGHLIHVCDIARAHTLAMNYLAVEKGLIRS
jgi:UDP-glucose 4-epimerase